MIKNYQTEDKTSADFISNLEGRKCLKFGGHCNIMDVAFELIDKIETGELKKYEGKEFETSKGGKRYKIDEKLNEEISGRSLTYKKIDKNESTPSTSVKKAGAFRLKDYDLILSQ
jgi:hypothetical protein